jgi:hypothetical protein
MMPDRETWMIAACYWVVGVFLIWGFFSERLRMPWPIAALLAVALAPISLLIVTYERRSEGKYARKREALRSEGRFEEAAEQEGSGTFYFLGMVWTGSYVGIGVFCLIGAIAFASPVALLAALVFGGWGGWRLFSYEQWRKEDLAHQRTSEQRIVTATDALERGGWSEHLSSATGAANPPSSSDDSPAGPTS